MSCTSRKSVAPTRNRILVYPDSTEEDEEYCSLPPLLSCFQTPQPCAIINSLHHNSHNEVDIDNMTIEEYARYELTMSTMKRAKNIRKMEHGIPNMCDDITDYVDRDQEDGELPDLPTFLATNEFASDSEQVEENIDIVEEKEEVHVKDVEMDENHDIDHSVVCCSTDSGLTILSSSGLPNLSRRFVTLVDSGLGTRSGLIRNLPAVWRETLGKWCILLYLVWLVKYTTYVRRIVVDFSYVPPNEYSPSPNDKKQ
nr:hypothetical protein [Tanacetum cinerariifolium]